MIFLNRGRKFVGYFWLAIVLIIFSVNLGDIGYFPFVHRHLSNEIFLLSNDMSFFSEISTDYIFETFAFFTIIFLIIFAWKKIINLKTSSEKFPISQNIAFFTLILALIILGIRGKTSGKPFGLSDAFVDDSIQSANLSLNGFYSIYRGAKPVSYNFMDNKKALEITQKLLKSPKMIFDSDKFPIQRQFTNTQDMKKYNFVILAVESLTSKYVDSFGNENFKVTPYFDKLAKESIKFPNFFSNGQRSIEGITSILTGIPSIHGMPNMGYGRELTNFSYFGQILKSHGYSTIGMRSAKKQSFRIDKSMMITGFDKVFGANDMRNYLKDEPDVKLPFNSVWDGNMLRFMKEQIDNSKKPFLTFGFTASTHFPCKLVSPKYEIYPHNNFSINGYLNNLRYFDSQLEEFIESAKKEKWFANTIFIITGDHTIGKGIGVSKKSLAHFKVPLIIYAPHIFKAQTINSIGTLTDIFPTIFDILNLKDNFSTFSNSLLDSKARKFGILREGNRMLFLKENGEYSDLQNSENLKAVLQTFSNLVRENRVSEN